MNISIFKIFTWLTFEGLQLILYVNDACVFFHDLCFVFALARTNLKKIGIKTDFQFYAALDECPKSGDLHVLTISVFVVCSPSTRAIGNPAIFRGRADLTPTRGGVNFGPTASHTVQELGLIA